MDYNHLETTDTTPSSSSLSIDLKGSNRTCCLYQGPNGFKNGNSRNDTLPNGKHLRSRTSPSSYHVNYLRTPSYTKRDDCDLLQSVDGGLSVARDRNKRGDAGSSKVLNSTSVKMLYPRRHKECKERNVDAGYCNGASNILWKYDPMPKEDRVKSKFTEEEIGNYGKEKGAGARKSPRDRSRKAAKDSSRKTPRDCRRTPDEEDSRKVDNNDKKSDPRKTRRESSRNTSCKGVKKESVDKVLDSMVIRRGDGSLEHSRTHTDTQVYGRHVMPPTYATRRNNDDFDHYLPFVDRSNNPLYMRATDVSNSSAYSLFGSGKQQHDKGSSDLDRRWGGKSHQRIKSSPRIATVPDLGFPNSEHTPSLIRRHHERIRTTPGGMNNVTPLLAQSMDGGVVRSCPQPQVMMEAPLRRIHSTRGSSSIGVRCNGRWELPDIPVNQKIINLTKNEVSERPIHGLPPCGESVRSDRSDIEGRGKGRRVGGHHTYPLRHYLCRESGHDTDHMSIDRGRGMTASPRQYVFPQSNQYHVPINCLKAPYDLQNRSTDTPDFAKRLSNSYRNQYIPSVYVAASTPTNHPNQSIPVKRTFRKEHSDYSDYDMPKFGTDR